MPDYSTVPCCEVFGTRNVSYGQDSITCTVQLKTDYGNGQLLANDILGGRKAWPWGVWAKAPRAQSGDLSYELTTYTESGQGIIYESSLLDLTYSTDQPEELATESLSPNVEFITLDYRKFRWQNANGDPLLEAEAPGRQLRSLILDRTIFEVPSIPNIVYDGIGGVNDVAYNSALLGKNFPAETLLYMPPKSNRSITTDGAGTWTLAMQFGFKPEGWNKFWRAHTQAYESIFSIEAGAVYNNFPLTDFSDLLA